MVNLGDEFPNFTADSTSGEIKFHDWLGNSWGILFSHPSDFTPVCTTELGRVAQLMPEFEKRKVKVIALSCDSVSSHEKWIDDIKSYSKIYTKGFPYPIIADESRHLAVQLGMLDPVEKDKDGLPLTCRAVFIVDPNKSLRLSILYPATTGRNFNEILRVLDSLQLTDTNKVATPVDWKTLSRCCSSSSVWVINLKLVAHTEEEEEHLNMRLCFKKQGDNCMVLPTVPEDEVNQLFPKGVSHVDMPSGKSYLRMTPQP